MASYLAVYMRDEALTVSEIVRTSVSEVRFEIKGLSRQKRSWQIWSGLYNITVEILRALTIKLTQARARTRARTRARDRAMARTTDRPRLRARARARAWECVYV